MVRLSSVHQGASGVQKMASRLQRLLMLTSRELARRFPEGNAWLLAKISFVAIPVLIGALMLMALFLWEADTNVRVPERIPFSAMAFVPDDARMDPAAAREALRKVAPVTTFDTQLSEAPVWFTFTPPALEHDEAGPPLVYFPSRHARTLACWRGSDLVALGSAARDEAAGALVAAKAGFATSGINLSGTPVLCRATFVGPARLSVTAWTAADFALSERRFVMDIGLLEGGLTVLAIFMLLVAIVNREPVYLVFAVWLVVNARLGAISQGWDAIWLGHQVPVAWLDGMRKLIFASNVPLTVFLFTRLLRDDLDKVGQRWLLSTIELLYVPMFAAALLLPYRLFIPVLWLCSALGYGALVYFLGRILLVSRSRIALWYAASLVVTAVAGYAEVIKAMFGLTGLTSFGNSVTAALCSGLLVAMAIAEQMRLERNGRRDAELALRKTYDQVPVAFFTADTGGQILRGNPALGDLLGQATLAGESRWPQIFEAGSWESLNAMLAANPHAEMRFRSADLGKWYEVRASLSEGLVEGSLEDVTETVSANQRLKHLADHDQLTGALSRWAIEKELRGAIRSANAASPVSLAYLDLDRFKTVNDLFGHTSGDEVLRQLCRLIEDSLGRGHILGRVGGDEFLILLRGMTLAEATAKCRDFAALIDRTTFQVQELAFRIGVSFGVVEVKPGVELVDLVSAADRACREAKSSATVSNVVAYGPDARAFKEHEEERQLVARLTREQLPEFLSIALQPIMSLDNPYGSLDFEVLLRARTPDGRPLPAGRVIAVAESHGRVGLIDRWILQTVLEWLDANLHCLTATRFVTVNFSGASINDEQFIADAYALLKAHPRAAARLCVEITEGVALRDFSQTQRVIDRLREFDVKVALDDFGAGYTSFMYLCDLQVDLIKIDGAIVESAARHPSRLSVVQAIADLARNLGIRSVAEWVEDPATLRAMAEVGIDYIQGFGIAKPVPASELLLAPHAAHWITDPAMKAALADVQNHMVIDDNAFYGGAAMMSLH